MVGAILTTSAAATIMLLMSNTAPDAPNASATRTATIVLNGDINRVFPLFGFLEEAKWSRGWDPQVVALGASLQDSVFTVTDNGVTATWIVAEYDEHQHRATYAVFVPNSRAMTIRITCKPDGNKTRVQVAYTMASLGENGVAALRDFEQQDFAKRLEHWQHAIDHYLGTGKQWQGDSH
jgi:Polyketide cyclase / dehydrase and lipid transport